MGDVLLSGCIGGVAVFDTVTATGNGKSEPRMAKRRRRKTVLDLEVRGESDAPFHWPDWHAPAEELPAESPHERLRVHRGFRSRILPDRRDLIVYLPPGYEADSERTYPVLYLNDGQNLFDPETSFIKGKTWQVRETADAAI